MNKWRMTLRVPLYGSIYAFALVAPLCAQFKIPARFQTASISQTIYDYRTWANSFKGMGAEKVVKDVRMRRIIVGFTPRTKHDSLYHSYLQHMSWSEDETTVTGARYIMSVGVFHDTRNGAGGVLWVDAKKKIGIGATYDVAGPYTTMTLFSNEFEPTTLPRDFLEKLSLMNIGNNGTNNTGKLATKVFFVDSHGKTLELNEFERE